MAVFIPVPTTKLSIWKSVEKDSVFLSIGLKSGGQVEHRNTVSFCKFLDTVIRIKNIIDMELFHELPSLSRIRMDLNATA